MPAFSVQTPSFPQSMLDSGSVHTRAPDQAKQDRQGGEAYRKSANKRAKAKMDVSDEANPSSTIAVGGLTRKQGEDTERLMKREEKLVRMMKRNNQVEKDGEDVEEEKDNERGSHERRGFHYGAQAWRRQSQSKRDFLVSDLLRHNVVRRVCDPPNFQQTAWSRLLSLRIVLRYCCNE